MLPQGLTGHIPRNEISWFCKRAIPEDFFRVGQEVLVKVIAVKRSASNALIATLSSRAVHPNPWPNIETGNPVNSVTSARVVEFLPFGATVRLRTGFHALLHDSEVSWSSPIAEAGEKPRRKPRAADFLRIGETIDVLVQRIDAEKRKIWVSHKLATPCPWDSVVIDYPPATGQPDSC